MTKTHAVSGGSMPRKAPQVKAGCENPSPGSRHVDVGITHKTSMPAAAMAGSFARKAPAGKAGQSVAGKASPAPVIAHKTKKLTKGMGGKGPRLQ